MKALVAVLLCCVFFSLVIGCAANLEDSVPEATAPKLYWSEPRTGVVDTNDYVRLQSKLPFKLVLPRVIPEDLPRTPVFHKYPELAGYIIDSIRKAESVTEVVITYREVPVRNFSNYLIIHENNSTHEWPNDIFRWAETDNHWIHDQTQIREIYDDVLGYSYYWYLNSVRFKLDINGSGYSNSLCQQVVKSMFD